MEIKIDNPWPLTVVRPVRENALQKELVSNFPSQQTKERITLKNLAERKAGALLEKGTFVDVYI